MNNKATPPASDDEQEDAHPPVPPGPHMHDPALLGDAVKMLPRGRGPTPNRQRHTSDPRRAAPQ